jgi:DNA adenine methylase
MPSVPSPLQLVSSDLAAPFKWRGGKRRVGAQVWARFGHVGHYVEPFLGGAGVLLTRPFEGSHPTGLESVGDLDGLLVNFWRAMKEQPDLVAHHARFPPSDVDLHMRHAWLRAHRADWVPSPAASRSAWRASTATHERVR